MRIARVFSPVAICSSLVIGLSGCALVATVSPDVDSQLLPDTSALHTAAPVAYPTPRFVPSDATMIRIDYDTRSGTAIMTYTSEKHTTAGACTGGVHTPTPPLQDTWWPVTGIPHTSSACAGGWSVFTIGNQVFASTTGES